MQIEEYYDCYMDANWYFNEKIKGRTSNNGSRAKFNDKREKIEKNRETKQKGRKERKERERERERE